MTFVVVNMAYRHVYYSIPYVVSNDHSPLSVKQYVLYSLVMATASRTRGRLPRNNGHCTKFMLIS